MKKIVFVAPSWTAGYGRFNPARYFARTYALWPPLALTLLATIAQRKGYMVHIIDGEIEQLSIPQITKKIIAIAPDYVAFTGTTPFYDLTKQMAKSLVGIPGYNPILVLGGGHVSNCKMTDDDFSMFDYCFRGESERSWEKFLDMNATKNEVPVVFESDPVDNIDDILYPDRSLLKYQLYKIKTKFGIKNFTSIIHSRGCPFNCIFCSSKGFSRKIRIRSPESFVDELSWINSTLGIDFFSIISDTFTMNRDNIIKTCDLIKKKGLRIHFEADTRANLVDDELMKNMAEAGLVSMVYGLESADEQVRKIMHKDGVPLEAYIKANEIAHKYGVVTQNATMIGMPGDTIETIKKTMYFLRTNRSIQQSNVAIAVPYPGTILYDMAKKGEHNLKLETQDFSQFKRYGFSVMSVGDLTPARLKEIQYECFASIYAPWWRWKSTIHRSGWLGLATHLYKVLKVFFSFRWEFLFTSKLKPK